MRKKPKFKMNSHVRLTSLGRFFLKAISHGEEIWPIEGTFLVLGQQDRTARDEGLDYLLENVENPNHPILWAPEVWLEKAN